MPRHPKAADLPVLVAKLCDAGVEFIIVGGIGSASGRQRDRGRARSRRRARTGASRAGSQARQERRRHAIRPLDVDHEGLEPLLVIHVGQARRAGPHHAGVVHEDIDRRAVQLGGQRRDRSRVPDVELGEPQVPTGGPEGLEPGLAAVIAIRRDHSVTAGEPLRGQLEPDASPCSGDDEHGSV